MSGATRRSAARAVPVRRRALSAVVGLLAGIGAAAAVVLAWAAPATAHAVLQSTTPADRSQLDVAPEEVVLAFSEAVSAPVGAVRAFDAGGARVDDGELAVDGGTLRLGLQQGLGDGAYVVTYRVISADSHPITGAFTFTVGDAEQATDDTVAGLLGSEDDSTWDVAGGIARFLAYAGALGAAGIGAFLVLAHDGGTETVRLQRVLLAAAATGAVGLLAAVPISAARITGLGIGAIGETGVASEVLQDGVGLSTGVVAVGLAALLLGNGRNRPLTLAGAVGATAGFALAGHTTTAEPRWPVTIADAVHAMAGAVWFGGLVAMAVVLQARQGERAAGAAPVVGRFSSTAAIALVAVGAAGLLVGWREVRTLDALTSTTYGKLLLAKVAVVAAVAAMGAWNRFRLVPAMAAAPRRAAAALRRAVTVEAAALLGALAVTAALVNVTPAVTAAGIGTIFSETVPLGEGSVNVVVDPNRAGTNALHLYVFDRAGRVSGADFDDVTIRLSLPSAQVGPLEREPFLAGPGHFQLDGGDLSIPGTWTVEVVARVDTFEQLTAEVQVPVNP
jgi:copper transport protein